MESKFLEDLVEIQSGYQARGKIKESPKGSHCLVQARDIANDAINWETSLTFNPDINPNRYKIKHHDILFIARGYDNKAYLATNPPQNVLASNTFYIIKPKQIHPIFLAWWLNERKAQAYFAQFQVKQRFSYMSKTNLGKLMVPVPDSSKQEKITTLLQLWDKERYLLTEINSAKQKFITTIILSAINEKER